MNGLIKKAGLGIALAATALTAAAPADAQRYRGGRHYDRGGNVAGAAILGGILGLGVGAVIASNNRGGYYDRGYAYDRGYYPPPPPPRVYYQNDYYQDYQPRCFSQWRYDPYYGQRVRVQVCN